VTLCDTLLGVDGTAQRAAAVGRECTQGRRQG
jgi:hypothetical protein